MCTVSQGSYIYPRKHKRSPSGGRLKWFVTQWEEQWSHPFQLELLRQGYHLPFKEHPKLSRTPCIYSGYSEVNKENALLTSIRDLLVKNAIERVNREDSLGFYSQLFREPMETSDRSQLPKSIPHSLQMQDGNSRVNPCFTQTRGMGHLNRPLRYILTSSHSPSIKKVSQVPSQRRFISIQQPTLQVSHRSSGLHISGEGGKTASLKTRHSPTPVPGQLANQSTLPGRIPKTHNQTFLSGSKPGLHSKPTEVRTHSPTEVRLHRLPVFTRPGSCQTHRRQME